MFGDVEMLNQGWRLRLATAVFSLSLASTVAFGNELDLAAYRGKVVYIDFWASWCGPCRQSFPWISALKRQYGAQNFVVLAINVDHERRKADRFLEDVPADFPILYDPGGELASEYKVSAMPSSFLVDRNGRIRYHHNGFSTKETADYERQITELLNEKPPKTD